MAYYESLGDRARAQIYKDLSMKSGKESVLNRKYDFQEMAKGFMENLDNLGPFFALSNSTDVTNSFGVFGL